jgi:hypothetical protein
MYETKLSSSAQKLNQVPSGCKMIANHWPTFWHWALAIEDLTEKEKLERLFFQTFFGALKEYEEKW